jgi:hypothetical protein
MVVGENWREVAGEPNTKLADPERIEDSSSVTDNSQSSLPNRREMAGSELPKITPSVVEKETTSICCMLSSLGPWEKLQKTGTIPSPLHRNKDPNAMPSEVNFFC